MRALELVAGNNGAAVAINDKGLIVGHVYQSPATPRTDFHRACIWSEAGARLIPETSERWSEARDVNEQDYVLGWCQGKDQMCSFVWSADAGLRLIEGELGRPFYASCINDVGTVAGEADDSAGTRRGMIWTPSEGLRLLPVQFSFHPMSLDNEGNVVGHDAERPWSRAWLLRADGSIHELPSGGQRHSAEAKAIVNGSIYGHVRGEGRKHVHPIRWDIAGRAA